MLKSIRKHNKKIMVVFSSILLLAWLAPETVRQFGASGARTIVSRMDGAAIHADEFAIAQREVSALDRIADFFVRDLLQVQDRNPHHWAMLVREAEAAGLVGGPEDGKAFRRVLAEAMLRRDQNLMAQLMRSSPTPEQVEGILDRLGNDGVNRHFVEQGTRNLGEIDTALARANGIYRLVNQYGGAARFSDKRAAMAIRHDRDATVIDAVVIPAARVAASMPEPTEAEVQAQFDRFKGVRPGEGEYGIGYLLPARVRLETMTIDREAIEKAVTLDPVEVLKRHKTNKDKYRGDFGADKARVESDMRGEIVERALTDAQAVVQAEVLRAKRLLGDAGKFKVLPADWEATRPSWDSIAKLIVETVKKNQKLDIPAPVVARRTDSWLTRQDVERLPGLGAGFLRQGSVQTPASEVLFAAKEFGGSGEGLAVQAGMPIELPFVDSLGNRIYVTLTAARGESAPDAVAEIREQVSKDARTLRAFESLSGRQDELRRLALEKGLAAVADQFPAVAGVSDPKDPASKPLSVNKELIVERTQTMGMRGITDEATFRAPINAAADELESLGLTATLPAEKATLAIAVKSRLSVSVVVVKRLRPFTREDFAGREGGSMQRAMQGEYADLGTDVYPFSLPQMLKRHRYEMKDTRVDTPEALKKLEKSDKPGA